MKIAFFTNTYLPNLYGSTNSVRYFKRGLEELGHEVYIFAPRFNGYVDKDKKTVRNPSFHWEYKIEYPIAYPSYLPLRAVIQELDLDLIHCHQPFNLGKTGMKLAKKFNLPLVFTNHCKYEEYTHYVPFPFQKTLKKCVIKYATRFSNKCDQVIAPSSSVKRVIRNRGVKVPIEIIPTGIDWQKFQIKNGSKIRKKYGIKDDEMLLLNTGRIEIEKNVTFLFNSVLKILKRNKKVKFMIAGTGSQKKSLIARAKKEGVQNKIIFIGSVKYEKIPQYYHAANIFVHASTSETQGMTINEAMAAGLAVVAVDASGVEDSIENNVDGILTSEDRNEFTLAIEAVIENTEKRKRISQRAVESSRNFDYLNQARKMEKIYKGLVNSGRLRKS